MAKILYCGDAFVETGFGRVAQNILPALNEAHDLHIMGCNYWGDYDPKAEGYKVYPAGIYGSDPFGGHRIVDLVQQIKPDLVWVTNDFWIALEYWRKLKPVQEELDFKFYCYSPIDSYGIFEELIPNVEEWDGFGTYTEFGAKEMKKAGYSQKIDIIPHGIDTEMFYPIGMQQCREELGVPQDTFIVFNGNRNQPRKRIDITIRGFIQFAKDKPDARLWLNMGTKDLGWDIIPLFKRIAKEYGYDSKEKLIITSPNFSTDNCLSVEQLNMVYNAADVGVNTCIGEGWGLVNFEHAATCVPQIVPDHTSLKEIFHSIPRIGIESWEVDRNYGLDRGVPSASHLAHLLDEYYASPGLRESDGKWCYDRVLEKQFQWPVIQKQMLKIMDRVLNQTKDSDFKGFGSPVRID